MMRLPRVLISILFLYVVLLMCVDAFFIRSVPAFGWDSLIFWLRESQLTLDGMLSTEYRNGEWTHPQPRTIIEVISACRQIDLPYQYGWFAISMAFLVAATWDLSTQKVAFIAFLAATAMVLSVPLWESHIVIVGYADLMIAAFFGLALKFARNALANKLKINLVVFALICIALPYIKNTGSAYAGLLFITFFQARCLSALPELNVIIILMIVAMIFVGPSLMEAINQHSSFVYAGNELVIRKHSGLDIAKNWWFALFHNASFSILPILALIIICNVISTENRPEISFPVLAIINLFGMLSVSQWFNYGFVHALPNADTGNSRFFLPMVAAMVYILNDVLTEYDLKKNSIRPVSKTIL